MIRILLLSIFILFPFFLPACISPEGGNSNEYYENKDSNIKALKDFHSAIPAGYYVALVGGNPSKVLESKYVQNLITLLKLNSNENARNVLFQLISFLYKINCIEVLYSLDPSASVTYIGGDLSVTDIIDFVRIARNNENEIVEISHNGNPYLKIDELNVYGILGCADGFMFAREDKIKQIIDFKTKDRKSVADTLDYISIYELVDTDGDIFAAYWGKFTIDTNTLLNTTTSSTDDEAWLSMANKLHRSIRNINAVGISAYFSESEKDVIRIRFDKAEIVEELQELLESNVVKLLNEWEKYLEVSLPNDVTKNMNKIGLTPHRIRKLAKEINIKVKDNILEIKGGHVIFTIAGITIPRLLNALDRARQATTVTNVVALGQMVDRYIMDNPRIGAPKASNIKELVKILKDSYYYINDSLLKDGWGWQIKYQVDMSYGSRHYSVISLGADGIKGPSVVPNMYGEYIVGRFDEDIIYSEGRLVQHPGGAQYNPR